MEPAVTGALYTAENLLSGAAALIKGIAHPTLPLIANLTHITSAPLPRAHHTLSVVKGRAYIFGGESAPGVLAENAMHIVILPSSGVLDADYTSIAARPSSVGGAVPASRKDHTAAVVGDNIYIFGGTGADSAGLNEEGRVWVFSTASSSWSFLDAAPGTLFPSGRAGHASAASELPSPKTVTYRERAPQQPADPAEVVPEPPEPDSWGTVFVVGGKDALTGELLDDALAFDVRTRTWSNIPTPTSQPREGSSLSLQGNRLYRFGGKGIETQASGAMESVDVSPVWVHAEGGTTPLTSGWAWEELPHLEGNEAPRARSGAGLSGVTTGQGRHYLLLIGGEAEGSSFLDDIWAFQLPSGKASAALTKDNVRAGLKRDTHESKWAETKYKYVDARGEEEEEIPGKPKSGVGWRGAFAVAKGTEVDGASVVVWGGVSPGGEVLGDGWLVTVDR